MFSLKGKYPFDLAAAPRRSSFVDAHLNPPEKPRGFLSFLTSPFFVAQLFVVEQLFGETARPASGAEEPDIQQPTPTPPAAEDPGPQPLDSVSKAAVDIPTSPDAPVSSPGHATGFGEPTHGVGHPSVDLNPIATNALPHTELDAVTHPLDQLIGGIDPVGAVAAPVEHVATGALPELGLVSHVLDHFNPEAAPAADANGGTVDHIPGATASLADAILETFGTTSHSLTGGEGRVASEALSTIGVAAETFIPASHASLHSDASIVHWASSAITLDPSSSLSSSLSDSGLQHSGSGALVGASSASMPGVAADVAQVASHGGAFLGSGGTISLADPLPATGAADELFTSGRYTDYGVTLSSAHGADTSILGHTLDPGIAEAPPTADLHPPTHSDPPVDHGHDPVGSLTHIGLHVGDGLV